MVLWSEFRPEVPRDRACGSGACPWPEPGRLGSEDSRTQLSHQGGPPAVV